MAFATIAQLKAVIPVRDLELLTDFEGIDLPSDTRLEQALDDASAEISGYVGKLIAGLADVPHVLTVICRDLAMHRLYINLGHETNPYEGLRKTHLVWLASVKKGDVSLGDDDGTVIESSPGVAMTDGPEREFTRASLKGY